MPKLKHREFQLLRNCYGLDTVYTIVLLAAFFISIGAHVGMGKLPVPGFLFGSDLSDTDELEVSWAFSTKEDKPEDLAKETPEPEKPRFVETNPEAPENEPDQTQNESDRNQQSAQEELEPDLPEDAPKVEGETPDSQKIIQGHIAEKAPKPESGIFSLNTPSLPNKSKETEGEDEKKSSAPLPPPSAPETIEKGPGEGVASILQNKFETTKPTRNTTIPLTLPTRPDPRSTSIEELTPRKVEPRRPLPRPKLPASVVPGPLRDTKTSAARTGTLAIDAKWSEFGEYTQRMIAAISLQWHKLAYNARLDTELASTVHVRFILNNQGEVESLKIIETSAGKLASVLCKDAIASRAPFGKWTADMVNTFGARTDVNIRFRYR